MAISLSIICLMMGAVLGSFICCQVRRTFRRRKEKWSYCESCKKKLGWRDKIPIISWLLLGGKCRYCNKAIGKMELTSEIVGALLLLLTFWSWPHSLGGPESLVSGDIKTYILFGVFLLFLVLFCELALVDIKYKKMPGAKLWLLVLFGGLFLITRLVCCEINIMNELLAVLGASSILGGVYYVMNKASKGRWVGDGDALIALASALVLAHPEMAVWDLFLANLMGVVLVLVFRRFMRKVKYIPMVPFLFIGFCVVFVFFFDFYHM